MKIAFFKNISFAVNGIEESLLYYNNNTEWTDMPSFQKIDAKLAKLKNLKLPPNTKSRLEFQNL